MIGNIDKAALDESILAVLKERGFLPTYVIKNFLRRELKGIKTSRVLAGCRRLEKSCRVKVNEHYSCVNSISWEIVPEAKQAEG